MSNIQTISQARFDEKVNLAVTLQPIRKTVALGRINVVNTEVVEIDGKRIPMSKKAFSQLAKILGVPMQFQGRVDKLFGEEASRSIVNKMKSALIGHGMSQITAIASPQAKEIVGFVKKESEYISNNTFFEIAKNIISDHNLSVRDFSITPSDGSVSINCFNPDAEFELGGLKDEFFQGGLSLSNSIDKGLFVSPYLNRLVCTNGLIGDSFSETYKLKSVHDFHLDGFRSHLAELEKRNYKPMSFEERVNKATTTMASFAELEGSANLILGSCSAMMNEISNWIPYEATANQYTKFGLAPIRMSEEQKKNAKTGTSVWDMVNGLTHFATHDSVFKVSESSRRYIQKEAGSILAGKFDMENLVISPF